MQKLITKLKNFKLAGMVNSLEARVAYANNNSLSHSEFLNFFVRMSQITEAIIAIIREFPKPNYQH